MKQKVPSISSVAYRISEAKTIRHVGDPEERFERMPLQNMRAIRLLRS